MKKIYLNILSLVSLFGCGNSSYHEKLIHNKYLIAEEGLENMDISISIPNSDAYEGLIPSCVFSVGNNDAFIIAKQHPYEFPNINKKITNYYIIPSNSKDVQKENTKVIGPMTEQEFIIKASEFGISKISFNKVFKELE